MSEAARCLQLTHCWILGGRGPHGTAGWLRGSSTKTRLSNGSGGNSWLALCGNVVFTGQHVVFGVVGVDDLLAGQSTVRDSKSGYGHCPFVPGSQGPVFRSYLA